MPHLHPARSSSAALLVPYEADLVYTKYHAVVAWQVTETLSLAAGVSYDDSDVKIKTNALEFDGDDNTIGYSLSALWQPSTKHSFGLNYQAKTEVTYDGDTTINGAGKFDSEGRPDISRVHRIRLLIPSE